MSHNSNHHGVGFNFSTPLLGPLTLPKHSFHLVKSLLTLFLDQISSVELQDFNLCFLIYVHLPANLRFYVPALKLVLTPLPLVSPLLRSLRRCSSHIGLDEILRAFPPGPTIAHHKVLCDSIETFLCLCLLLLHGKAFIQVLDRGHSILPLTILSLNLNLLHPLLRLNLVVREGNLNIELPIWHARLEKYV